MLSNQDIKNFPYIQSGIVFQYIGNNVLQINSFVKGTKNSFLIK